jgi:superfamily II DNA or RNA helicase
VGKTLAAAEFIRNHKMKTLFIVDTLDLLLQAKKEFENTLGMDIGIIGGGEFKEEFITVATWQSLIKKCNNVFFDRQQCVILDECQIGACKSIKTILNQCVYTHYRLGLSATPIHDSDDMQIEALLGDVEYNLKTTEAQEKGYLVNSEVIFYHMSINSEEYDFRSDYDYNIVQHPIRNKFIADYVIEKSNLGETSIILTKSIEHGKILNDIIPNSFHIHGVINKNVREDKWEELRSKGINVIIATTKIASKGLNIKSLNNIVNAGANGNGRDSVQALGRTLRLFNDKDKGTYIDFLDKGKYTKTWSRIRFKTLENEGHNIIVKQKI